MRPTECWTWDLSLKFVKSSKNETSQHGTIVQRSCFRQLFLPRSSSLRRNSCARKYCPLFCHCSLPTTYTKLESWLRRPIVTTRSLNRYVWIAVGRVGSTVDSITQRIVQLSAPSKQERLKHCVKALNETEGRTLVFVQKKATARWVSRQLTRLSEEGQISGVFLSAKVDSFGSSTRIEEEKCKYERRMFPACLLQTNRACHSHSRGPLSVTARSSSQAVSRWDSACACRD